MHIGQSAVSQRMQKQAAVLCIVFLHYLYIDAVVLLSGLYFGWFHLDSIQMVLSMLLMIACIFLIVYTTLQLRSKRDTTLMNERLQKYYKKRTS